MTAAQKVAAVTGAFLVCGAVALALVSRGRRTTDLPARPATGLTASLAVEAFHTGDPPPRLWTSAAFAESLATRLARMPGLTVRTGVDTFASAPEFAIRGEVTTREGRLVLAVRLHRRGDGDAIWTATFWRTDALTSDLVSDLAGAIAEAVYGQLARSAVITTGERP